ncbi:hypothetical protein C8J56DRAFT_482789 [Mycena floridula]|nr:hypothetical protein C8J56DRAFT_482789 [Mycena floridula]
MIPSFCNLVPRMHLEISELLASSSPLTEPERVYLNQLLDTSNDEISRLTAAIDKLVLERGKLQSNVVAYKAVLAPIRLLPAEMLREIFVNCLPSNKPAAIAITEAPLLLGRICRSWREIALSTPGLWASIHVQFLHQFDSFRVQRLCDEAHAWISRSGTCPLTIGVTCRNDDPIANTFLQSLTELSRRWRSVDIEAPAEWMSSLTLLPRSDVPRLEKFRHSVIAGGIPRMERDRQISETLWESLDILAGQRLRDVSLHNAWVQHPVVAASHINFGQLTRLDFSAGSHFTLLDAADILRRCPNLIACHLSIAIPHSTDVAWKFESVTLLHLTSFTIDLAPSFPSESSLVDVVLGGFFSTLNLPQLASFCPYMGSYTSWIALARASPIENLTLSLSDLVHESVLEYLRTSTYLKRLRFNTWPYMSQDNMPGPELDLFMAIDNSSDVICPFLEVLELPNFGFPEEIFVNLVKRRTALKNSQGKTQLKVVRANYTITGTIQLDVLSQLDDLMTSGLRLSVSYYRLMKPADMIAYWPCQLQLPELEWP